MHSALARGARAVLSEPVMWCVLTLSATDNVPDSALALCGGEFVHSGQTGFAEVNLPTVDKFAGRSLLAHSNLKPPRARSAYSCSRFRSGNKFPTKKYPS
jgi:hypothetical protein